MVYKSYNQNTWHSLATLIEVYKVKLTVSDVVTALHMVLIIY